MNSNQRRFWDQTRSVRAKEDSAARNRFNELRNSVRSVNASGIEHRIRRLNQLLESFATRTEVENLYAGSRNLPDNICQRSKIDIGNLKLRMLRPSVFKRRRNLHEQPELSRKRQ